MTSKNTRREVVKQSIALAGLISFFGVGALARAKRGGDKANNDMAIPGEGIALQFQYQHDKAKIKDTSIKKEKHGIAFDKQYCNNCQFYTLDSNGLGKCQILQNKLVKENGWCISWTPKA